MRRPLKHARYILPERQPKTVNHRLLLFVFSTYTCPSSIACHSQGAGPAQTREVAVLQALGLEVASQGNRAAAAGHPADRAGKEGSHLVEEMGDRPGAWADLERRGKEA